MSPNPLRSNVLTCLLLLLAVTPVHGQEAGAPSPEAAPPAEPPAAPPAPPAVAVPPPPEARSPSPSDTAAPEQDVPAEPSKPVKREPAKKAAAPAPADAGVGTGPGTGTEAAATKPVKPAGPGKPATPAAPPPVAAAAPAVGTSAHKVELEARAFFEALLTGNARAAVAACTFPFTLEDQTFQTAQELVDEWAKQLRHRRTDLLQLSSLEVLTPNDMEKKYGKPPQRLSAFPWRNSGSYVVVARLSGRTAVAIFRENATAKSYRAVAYHD